MIDPLIDGVIGSQSVATHLEEKRVVALVKNNYPRFQVARFSADTVAKAPVVLIGTFTAVNNAGVVNGRREAYRIFFCGIDDRQYAIERYRFVPGIDIALKWRIDRNEIIGAVDLDAVPA